MIIKSLARGFRNLADQQKFLEEFIPINGARFICTGTPFIDTYANPHSASGLEVPIRGMFNEQFAATTSEEIRKTFKMKRERGEFIGAFATYGYTSLSIWSILFLCPAPLLRGGLAAVYDLLRNQSINGGGFSGRRYDPPLYALKLCSVR